MKKLTKLWNSLPRPPRAVCNILLILLLVSTLYICIGSPALTLKQEFRRAEKASLVGPSRILGIEPLNEYYDYNNIVIADDGDGVILYGDYDGSWNKGILTYRKKQGDVTVLAVPCSVSRSHGIAEAKETEQTVFVIDDCPDAVYAELQLTLEADYDYVYFQKTYTMESRRTTPGYFRFSLSVSSDEALGAEGHALYLLSYISGDETYGSYWDTEIPATVWFYDETGELLSEKSVTIRTAAAEAHISRGQAIE